MARCTCRWRNAFVCMCMFMPCIILALLVIYVYVILSLHLDHIALEAGRKKGLDTPHFVAPGLYKNKGFALTPKTFWKIKENAFWNHVQIRMDRFVNPLLRPRNSKRKIKNDHFYDSLQRWSIAAMAKRYKPWRDKLTDQMQHFVVNMGSRNYPVLLEPKDACGAGSKVEKEPPLLLVAIKSTELNFAHRQAIRHTWGKEGWVKRQGRNSSVSDGGYIRRVFLLGRGNPLEQSGGNVSTLLQMESLFYKDILQWDFNDNFFNLTLKDVHFWRWFSKQCKKTLFILKGDDDVFVNTPNMVSFLRSYLKNPLKRRNLDNFMIGDVIDAAEPNRLNQSKYFIPTSFYMGRYPIYAGGGGVLYSAALAKRLLNISNTVHLFPIDDVFVGMCMERLNTRPIHHDAFLTFDFPKKELLSPCNYHTILLVHKRTPKELYTIWNSIMKRPHCWDVPLREDLKLKREMKG